MVALIQDRRPAVEALCRHYHVERLELFGSATGTGFNPTTSDVDLLVEFGSPEPADHFERYFGLLEALQELFGRPVDLVELGAIRNDRFRRAIERDRELLYAA